jgi:GxxExxY protein
MKKPQMDTDEHRLNEITARIIRCVNIVSNTLGNGFLEKVYENALAHELRKSGFLVEQQKGIKVRYDGIVVGDYMAYLLVQKEVLVELKAVRTLDNIHVAQWLNYLKATGFKVCLLLNFGTPKVQIRRLMN